MDRSYRLNLSMFERFERETRECYSFEPHMKGAKKMAVYNLHKTDHKDGTYGLHPNSTSYTEEYAEKVCSFYLTDEYVRNEHRNVDVFYRLNSPRTVHNNYQALIYDVCCPKCGGIMRQVTTN